MLLHEIVGHARQRALLAGAVTRDTLPQALLLAGPAGIGKRRTAVALAQLLNCLTPTGTTEAPDACGVCASCTRIARGVHPDVLLLEPGDSGTIKIDQVRDIVDKAAYRPFEGRRRVVIVDEADALVVPAQHALLKTLEEPPSMSVFVLVSSRPDVLLATVRSRCSRLRFGRLTQAEVAAVLERDHGVATALLERTARTSDPSQRLDAVKGLAGGKKRTAAEERAQLSGCLRAAASMLRDVCLIEAGVGAGALVNADLRGEIERLGAAFDADRAVRAFGVVDEAIAALERNASPKVVADWLAVHL